MGSWVAEVLEERRREMALDRRMWAEMKSRRRVILFILGRGITGSLAFRFERGKPLVTQSCMKNTHDDVNLLDHEIFGGK